MAFLKDLFSSKNKVTTKEFKETDNTRQICPIWVQGPIATQIRTLKETLHTVLQEDVYGYNKDEISVSVRIFNKDDKVFYALCLLRKLERPGEDSASYSNCLKYKVNGKYDVNLSISIFIKNRNKGGIDRAKSFYDAAISEFKRKCIIW